MTPLVDQGRRSVALYPVCVAQIGNEEVVLDPFGLLDDG